MLALLIPVHGSFAQQAATNPDDPLAYARSVTTVLNPEATVPPQCYTDTTRADGGASNPCWTCHTASNGRNLKNDVALQKSYAFSKAALDNHWSNLFVDRRAAIAAISDESALRYIREDNYTPLLTALRGRRDFLGQQPDLDYRRGFDEAGFARDGSGWRAFRYPPFPGTFWPTNGSSDDVLIRLPRAFRSDAQGRESQDIYRLNLAILEAAMTVGDQVSDAKILREVEAVSENLASLDLDGNGKIGGTVRSIRGLPLRYAGGAAGIKVTRWLYPVGVEFLHSLRYVDPDQPSLLSARFKELRYSVKRLWLDDAALAYAYREQAEEKTAGLLPAFRGNAETGLLNDFGWQLQGFIEDARGRLRLQTREEQTTCMGCHGGIGVTVDQTFGFPRKRPGAAGWGHQDLNDLRDLPQAGQREPETLRYFQRVGGGDEFRANSEILARFFPQARLDVAAVQRTRSLRDLIAPSRERALALNKAYMSLVREQTFERGRDALLQPPANVHRRIVNGDTGLSGKNAVYEDGRLWLDWPPLTTDRHSERSEESSLQPRPVLQEDPSLRSG